MAFINVARDRFSIFIKGSLQNNKKYIYLEMDRIMIWLDRWLAGYNPDNINNRKTDIWLFIKIKIKKVRFSLYTSIRYEAPDKDVS